MHLRACIAPALWIASIARAGAAQGPEAVAEEEVSVQARELPPAPDGSATQDPPAPYPEP